jgi:hypothetical protein
VSTEAVSAHWIFSVEIFEQTVTDDHAIVADYRHSTDRGQASKFFGLPNKVDPDMLEIQLFEKQGGARFRYIWPHDTE